MPSLETAVIRAFAALAKRRTKCALIGGLAVGVRAEPRTTRDGDLAVAVADDSEADAVVFSLRGLGYRPDEVFMQEVSNRIALVRFVGAPPENLRLDLTFEMSGIEREVVGAATQTAADVTVARKAVTLIKRRGYNRGRDLAGDLEKFVDVVKKLRAT